MQLENKNFCLAHISPVYWRIVSYKDTQENEHFFVIVPSIAFNRFILEREYCTLLSNFLNVLKKRMIG